MTLQTDPSQEVTQLLLDWREGNEEALHKLTPLVYKEMRKLAHRYLRKERAGQTLATTDLVHEAYLRLIDRRRIKWQNRTHFFAVAAQLMRRILVDRARRRGRIKRGGGAIMVSLDESTVASPQSAVDLIALDEALKKLEKIDQRKARVVELRFFGGLSVEEAADFLKVSQVTVMREWKMAKAWLHRAISVEQR